MSPRLRRILEQLAACAMTADELADALGTTRQALAARLAVARANGWARPDIRGRWRLAPAGRRELDRHDHLAAA